MASCDCNSTVIPLQHEPSPKEDAQHASESQKSERSHCEAPFADADAAYGALKPNDRRNAVRARTCGARASKSYVRERGRLRNFLRAVGFRGFRRHDTNHIIGEAQFGSRHAPRCARIVVGGSPHHVTQRGNRRPKRFWDELSSRSGPAESRKPKAVEQNG